jgi:hypothetical protein
MPTSFPIIDLLASSTYPLHSLILPCITCLLFLLFLKKSFSPPSPSFFLCPHHVLLLSAFPPSSSCSLPSYSCPLQILLTSNSLPHTLFTSS